jgi:hypothetical protein
LSLKGNLIYIYFFLNISKYCIKESVKIIVIIEENSEFSLK